MKEKRVSYFTERAMNIMNFMPLPNSYNLPSPPSIKITVSFHYHFVQANSKQRNLYRKTDEGSWYLEENT
jgi:hypothetical protein